METEYMTARMPINLAAKRKTRRMFVAELDMTITLRELSARQFLQLANNPDQVVVLSKMIEDEEGHRIFDSPEGLVSLGELGMGAFTGLVTAATELNGIATKQVEAVTKNASGEPSGDSASDSPVS
jgi:hypothetical protein